MNAFILAGATATGKTAVCQFLAERMGAAILSFDAMLVYKGMDIGTAKPTREEQRRVPYLGIDLFTPAETSNAALWLAGVKRQFAELPAGTPIIATGGTGLYLRALLAPFDAPPPSPESRARWQNLFETGGLAALQNALRERLAPGVYDAIPDVKNPRRLQRLLERHDAGEDLKPKPRPPLPPVVALNMPRHLLHQRIADRVRAMVASGFVEEVRALRNAYPVWSQTALAAIGYLDFLAYVDSRDETRFKETFALYHFDPGVSRDVVFEKLRPRMDASSLNAVIENVITRTRQYAKRQNAWIQHQLRPVWIDTMPAEPLEQLAGRVASAWQCHGAASLAL